MTQQERVGPVDEAVGYVLKQAGVALRNAMDEVLRPMGLTVPQYSCLEVLGQRPGLSNAELARSTFVTRQSMNVVLQNLEGRGLVTRPAAAPHGRELPAALTPAGAEQARAASAAVRAVERRMCGELTAQEQATLLELLRTCCRNLSGA